MPLFNWFRKPRKLSKELEGFVRQFAGGQVLAVAIAEAVRDHVQEIQSGRITFPAHRSRDASVLTIWRALRLQAFSCLFNFGKADGMLLADPLAQLKVLSCFLDERPHLEMPQPRGDTIPDTIQALWQAYVFLDAAGSEVADRETDRAWLKSQQRDILTDITHKATVLRAEWEAFHNRAPDAAPPKLPGTLIEALYADVTAKTKSIALSAKFGPYYEATVQQLEAKVRELGQDPREGRESFERILRASDPDDLAPH